MQLGEMMDEEVKTIQHWENSSYVKNRLVERAKIILFAHRVKRGKAAQKGLGLTKNDMEVAETVH